MTAPRWTAPVDGGAVDVDVDVDVGGRPPSDAMMEDHDPEVRSS